MVIHNSDTTSADSSGVAESTNIYFNLFLSRGTRKSELFDEPRLCIVAIYVPNRLTHAFCIVSTINVFLP